MPAPGNSTVKGRSGRKIVIRAALLALLVIAFSAGGMMIWYYLRVTRPIIRIEGKKFHYLYIPTGSGFKAVMDSLQAKKWLIRPDDFKWLAGIKEYDRKVKPGRYKITDGMSNNALVNILRAGLQEPVRITIRNARTRAELAGRIGRHLETDSGKLIMLFNDKEFLNRYDVTPATLFVLFIPNTYEFYWNTSGKQFFNRMHQEFQAFWNEDRRLQAGKLRLSISEVVILASIVEKETNVTSEKPVIAGVYLNRLRIRMPLQADPTVIYAWNDYTIRRVRKVHTEIKSPYNTYRVTGLPPGPICLPSVSSIDAVLQAEQHTYLYFCASEDRSGKHNFASTLDEHNRNARRYQQALNKMNIR